MASKIVLFLPLALTIQTIASQIIGQHGWRNHGYNFPQGGYSQLGGVGGNTPQTNGGGFQVQSFSPQSANGISVVSENVIEGQLAAGGQLPLAGAVGLESQMPSSGAASVNYCCGNNQVGINQASNPTPAKGSAGAAGN